MDAFNNLLMGFAVALSPSNIIFAFAGSVLGTLIGVLPGIGPSAGAAILIPLTFNMDPTGAIIMLSALYYGTQYGGTITSVLLNVPGEAASAITCLDGYALARQGKAGTALSLAAIGSFVGGLFATLCLVVAAIPLAKMALQFGPVEFFALLCLGLSLTMGLAGKSMIKALMMGILGLLVSLVGLDPVRGMPRFTFGSIALMDGIDFVPIIMGIFGLAEVLENAENVYGSVKLAAVNSLFPSKKDFRDSLAPMARGSLIGTCLGIIPGMTNSSASLISYIAEKKSSKTPEKFGTGMVQGVVGPETANNAHANGALIPLFTLGIPSSPTVAVIMGAFMMHGLVPGPFLFTEHPNIAWGVIASFVIGNVILLILNLPAIGLWVRILKIPYGLLFAIILCFMVLGAYSVNNSVLDIVIMVLFGIFGYFMKKQGFPMAPLVLTFILGPQMEKALRQSMELSQGSFGIFLKSPIATVLLLGTVAILVSPLFKYLKKGKKNSLEAAA